MDERSLTEGAVLSGDLSSRVLLLVGLGGTGKDILARVKRRLESLGGGTVPSRVGFLVVDVDPILPETAGLGDVLGPRNFCCPAAGTSASQIRELVQRDVGTGGRLAWLSERILLGELVSDDDDSSGSTERSRQAGLLAYLWEEATNGGVTGKLRESIAVVTAGAREALSPHVIIVSSTCGGTGSGMLVDIAYLARSMMSDHTANACDVSGVLVLPGAFRSLVDERIYRSLERNTAATLTELNYFMVPKQLRPTPARDPEGATWRLGSGEPGVLSPDTSGAVFQSVFLVDRPSGERGDHWGPQTIFPVIAEALLHLSGDLIGDPFLVAMNGARGTLRRRSLAQGSDGVWSSYGGLGLARIILPVRRMALEAAALLSADVSAMLIGGSEPPSEAVADGLLSGLGLEPEALGSALGLARGEVAASLAGAIDLRGSGLRLERIECLSDRVAEILRQASPPEALRRHCLDVLGKAEAVVTAALDQAERECRALTGRLAEALRDALGRQLVQVRGSDHGLEWLGKLVARLVECVGGRLASAEQPTVRDRVDAVDRAGEAARATQSRLEACPAGEVKRAAVAATRAADPWIAARVGLATDQMVERILGNSQATLRLIGDSVHSLLDLLTVVLPRETGQVVASLRAKDERETLPTDIRVQADGQVRYQAMRHASARTRIVTTCLERMSFTLIGDAVRVSGGSGESSLLEAGSDPVTATQRWLEHIVTHVETHFANVSLDEYVATDEAAERLVADGLWSAQVLLDCDRVSARGKAGEPIRATFVVAPEGSRLGRVLAAASPPGATHLVGKNPTQVVILQAEVGIGERALGSKKDTAAAEASLSTVPGVWTLGQLSHDLFWRDSERWSSLGLFFQAWAESRVMRQEIPPRLRGHGTPGHEYWLDCGQGRMILLGRGLQASVLEFVGPTCAEHRERLKRELPATPGQGPAIGTLLPIASGFAEIIEYPGEVPSGPLRKVLNLRLQDLTDKAQAAQSAGSAPNSTG
jgi:hypothetical protein